MGRPPKKVNNNMVEDDSSTIDLASDINNEFENRQKRGKKSSMKKSSGSSSEFDSVLDRYLGKTFPNSLITQLKDTTFMNTNMPDLNFLLSGRPNTGGIPLNGKITTVYGPEGCVSSDTIIKYYVHSCEYEKDNPEEQTDLVEKTIEDLFYDYHTIKFNTEEKIKYNYYIDSFDYSTGEFESRPIYDVVKTGTQECYKVTTKYNHLVSTMDHKYYVGNREFKELRELKVGDTLYTKFNDELIEDKIVYIECVGMKDTYDIKCVEPLNNYVANNILVHNSGKTSLIAHLLKLAIENGVLPVFLDTERSFEKRRFAQLGIDWTKMKHLWPTCVEEAFDIIEKVSELAIAHNVADKGILIMYDSLAGTLTNDEYERKMDQIEIASAAKVINRDMKKIKRIIEKANVGLVLIQQSRINMNKFGHADNYILPGGQGLKHNSDILLRMAKGKQDVDGQVVKFSTPSKNRLFKPRQSIESFFNYMDGFTLDQSLKNFASIMTEIGYLKRSGAWCYFENDPDNKFYGKDLAAKMLNDPEELNKLVTDVEKYIDENYLLINSLIGKDEIEDPENTNDIEADILST